MGTLENVLVVYWCPLLHITGIYRGIFEAIKGYYGQA